MSVPQAAPTRRSFDSRRNSDRRASDRRGSDRRSSGGGGRNSGFLSAIPVSHIGAPTRRSSGSTRGALEDTDSFDPENTELLPKRKPGKLVSQYSVTSVEAVVGSSRSDGPSKSPSSDRSAKTIGVVQQPKRLDSVMSMNPDAKRIYQMMIGDRPPPNNKLAPGKAEKLKGDVTSLMWTIPHTQQDEDTLSAVDAKEIKKPLLPIFSHKGVWVRPSSIGSKLEPLQTRVRAHPIEDHAGTIDGTFPIDVAHAILAFDFIDCINDDVLHHYLPTVDSTLSQDLGLRHNVHRLSIPGSEMPQQESVGDYDCTYSEGYSYEQSYDHSSSNEYCQVGGTGTPKEPGSWVDSCEERSVGMDSGQSWESGQIDDTEEPHCVSGPQTPGILSSEGAVSEVLTIRQESDIAVDDSASERSCLKEELSLDPTTGGPSLDVPGLLEEDSAHSLSATSLRVEVPTCTTNALFEEIRAQHPIRGPSKTLELSYGGDFLQIETVNSPEAQVWPHACSMFPKALSQTRSDKLRAVDSMPVRAFDIAGTPLHTTSTDGVFQTMHAGGWPMLNDSSRFRLGRRCDDPATTSSTVSTIYSAGASRVRGPGEFRRHRVHSKHNSMGRRRVPMHTIDSCGSTLLKEEVPSARRMSRDSKTSMEAGSIQPIHANGSLTSEQGPVGQGSTHITTTSNDTKVLSARKEEDHTSSIDNLGDLLSLHLQGESTLPHGDRLMKEQYSNANATCPFSHVSLDSSVSIFLRCGHRFALSHMNIARRGPSVCASAGFSLQDALICPLCGDQDVTTTPVGSKMLTTYSTTTDYYGEIRKDWQRPLLPIEDPKYSLPNESAEQGARKGLSYLPAILSARKA